MKKIISFISIFVFCFVFLINFVFAQVPSGSPIVLPSPTAPLISGPSGKLFVSTSYDFSVVSKDPNNRKVQYEIEFSNSGSNIFLPPFFQYVNDETAQIVSKSWSSSGSYWLRARAKNTNGDYSNWSDRYNVTISNVNSAPSIPVVVNQPSGTVYTPVTFEMYSSDPDNDYIKYEIDWNNNGSSDQIVPSPTPNPTPLSANYVASGITQTITKSWSTAGTYTIKFRAIDIEGASSNWTSKTVVINVPDTNIAPTNLTVLPITNQGAFYPSKSYVFNMNADDTAGDQLTYYVDWNNDTIIDSYAGPVAEDITATISNPANTWTTIGTKSFKVYVADSKSKATEWKSFSITLVAPPTPTVTLDVSPKYLIKNVPTKMTITWSSTNAESCHSVGPAWPGSNNTSGTYTTPGNIPGPRTIILVCEGNGLSATSSYYLHYPTNTTGWGWSSNIGHISLSSKNSGLSAGQDYGVDIATSSETNGMLFGYAWSPNIGWISFNDGDASHPNVTIDFETGNVTGWIRACAGTVNKDCKSASRIDGWDGWINLSGTNHESPRLDGSRGITYDKVSNKFVGYAWGSEVIGWLTLDIQCPECIIIKDNVPSCSQFTASPSLMNDQGGQSVINWKLINVDTSAEKCSISGTGLRSNTVNSATGNVIADVPRNTTSSEIKHEYSINCQTTPPTAPLVCKTNIIVPKKNIVTDSQLKMWVENDPLRLKSETVINEGRNAIINWNIGLNTNCSGENITDSNSKLPANGNWYKNSLPNTDNTTKISGLIRGIYEIKIKCENTGVAETRNSNTVKIIVKSSKIEEI